jgi:biotin carboxylase
MARVLALMTHTTYRAAPFVDAAAKLGVRLAVATDRRQVFEKDNPAGNLTIDFSDVERAVDRIAEFAREYPCDAIVAADDDGVLIAAAASRELGLPGNTVESVSAARNKYRTRLAFAAHGMRGPWFRSLSVDDDPLAAARAQEYPCVVKPLTLSASRGVMRANDPGEFVRAFLRLRSLLARREVALEAGDAARRILVEGYLPGSEVAVEGLLTRGRLRTLVVFDKPEPMQGPLFEETVFVAPSGLPPAVRERVLAETEGALRALGLEHGPVHVELRVDGESPTVLEVAPRSIGGNCSGAIRFDDGSSLEQLILRHALGEDLTPIELERGASGVMMLPIPGRGILREVRGLDQAAAVDGVTGVSNTIPIGHPLVPLPEGNRYLGFLFARGASVASVRRALAAAHACLGFEIEGDEAVTGTNSHRAE